MTARKTAVSRTGNSGGTRQLVTVSCYKPCTHQVPPSKPASAKAVQTNAGLSTNATLAIAARLDDRSAKLVAQADVGLRKLSPEEARKLDLNRDGKTNVVDAMFLAQRARRERSAAARGFLGLAKQAQADDDKARLISQALVGKVKLSVDQAKALDVGGNGRLDIGDALAFAKRAKGKREAAAAQRKAIADELLSLAKRIAEFAVRKRPAERGMDVSGDGKIDVGDALLAAQAANQLPALPAVAR